MTRKIRMLYRLACQDKDFNNLMLENDQDDKRPGIFAPRNVKVIYAAMYYGYLITMYSPQYVKGLLK